MVRKIVMLLVLLTLVASLGACGRKAEPDHPEGSTFPRQYPAR